MGLDGGRRQGVSGDFNPPTPCGVGLLEKVEALQEKLFQSTHPVRGGTDLPVAVHGILDISIHPPRAGWDQRPPGRR